MLVRVIDSVSRGRGKPRPKTAATLSQRPARLARNGATKAQGENDATPSRRPAPGHGRDGFRRGVLAGHGRTAAQPRAGELAHVPGHLRLPGLQPARSDQHGERRRPEAAVDVLHRHARRPPGPAGRQQRRHVHHHAEQPPGRAGRRDGRTALALRARAAGRPLADAPHQPGRGPLRQSRLHGDGGLLRRRPGRDHRRVGLGAGDRGLRRRLLHDAGPAGRGRQGDGRRLRRRMGHPRLRRRVGRADRRSPSGRPTRSPPLASRAANPGPAIRGRRAAFPCGSPAPTTPPPNSPTGAPATAAPGPATFATATISTPHRCSPSRSIPASSAPTISTTGTTRGTGTRSPLRS